MIVVAHGIVRCSCVTRAIILKTPSWGRANGFERNEKFQQLLGELQFKELPIIHPTPQNRDQALPQGYNGARQ